MPLWLLLITLWHQANQPPVVDPLPRAWSPDAPPPVYGPKAPWEP